MKFHFLIAVGFSFSLSQARAGEAAAAPPILAEVTPVAAPPTSPAPSAPEPAATPAAAQSPFARHFDQLLTESFQAPEPPTAVLKTVVRPLPNSVGTSATGTATSLFQNIPMETISLPPR